MICKIFEFLDLYSLHESSLTCVEWFLYSKEKSSFSGNLLFCHKLNETILNNTKKWIKDININSMTLDSSYLDDPKFESKNEYIRSEMIPILLKNCHNV